MNRPQTLTTNPDVRGATGNDLAGIQALLKQAALPFEDLKPRSLQDFVVVHDSNGIMIGAGGIERYERDGLLRSVVVHESARGSGLGMRITGAVEERARENGVTALYLLTTTAVAFFARLGYQRFERNNVPEALKHSEEFASLCPASAVCMRKQLV